MKAEGMILSRGMIDTPLGPMLALATPDGLCALEFTHLRASRSGGQASRLTRLDARRSRWFPPHEIVDKETAVIKRARRWLDAYFKGTAADVDDFPIAMHGAPFETRVWQALLEIPAGETRSYGSIAKALGSPDASRAVGAANGANPIAIIVPCHRVIGSTGSLVGYGGGLERKTWLLDHERRWRRDSLF